MVQTTEKSPYFTKEKVVREWYLVDAENQILGRLCTQIAKLLMGKHKPTFTPGQDTGAFVVVVNAEKIRVTGGKEDKKIYYRHSMRPGGLKAETLRQKLAKSPKKVIMDSVKGMLPKNKLGSRLITKLKVYAGAHHPHQAQMPIPLSPEELYRI